MGPEVVSGCLFCLTLYMHRFTLNGCQVKPSVQQKRWGGGGNKILSHLSVQICVPNFSSSGYEHSAVWVRQRRWVSCKVFFYFLTKCRPCVTIPPLKLSKETLKGTKSNCNSRRSLSDFGNFPFWSLIFIFSQIGIAVHFVAKGCYSQLCCNLFM